MLIDEECTIKRAPSKAEKVADEWESIPHHDIDVGDESDPQLCCVYVNDIYEYLRENEVCLFSFSHPSSPHYLFLSI